MDINESVKIKFVGKNNTIHNVVSFGQFEKVYKPKGWILNEVQVEEPKEKPVEKIIEELKTTNETEIKNITTAKKKASANVNFNDKIIKD